jgi:uncharacterized protein (TIGR00255 family)
MVISMTAFARKAQETPGGNAVWEIRSVNHRFLDISARLPEEFRALELNVRDRIGSRIGRGKLDCLLRLEANGGVGEHFVVNVELAQRVAAAAAQISDILDNPAPINSLDVLRWPGVMTLQAPDPEALGGTLLELLDEAIDALVEARKREGNKLGEAIRARVQEARRQLAILRERAPQIIQAVKDRYSQRLTELKADFDSGRLEQELLLLAQKLDVAEELDRLQTHLDELERILGDDKPIGRRLDFMVQELNREANTLASKSSHADTSGAAVELKVLIEQMREQIQNIE